jgi:hypothetical protein
VRPAPSSLLLPPPPPPPPPPVAKEASSYYHNYAARRQQLEQNAQQQRLQQQWFNRRARERRASAGQAQSSIELHTVRAPVGHPHQAPAIRPPPDLECGDYTDYERYEAQPAASPERWFRSRSCPPPPPGRPFAYDEYC